MDNLNYANFWYIIEINYPVSKQSFDIWFNGYCCGWHWQKVFNDEAYQFDNLPYCVQIGLLLSFFGESKIELNLNINFYPIADFIKRLTYIFKQLETIKTLNN